MRSPCRLEVLVSFATLSIALALPTGASAAPVGQAAPTDDPPAATGADGADEHAASSGGGELSPEARAEAITKIVNACKENPNQGGCVKLRAACEEKRGHWQKDMARMCPELVGGGAPTVAQLGQDDGGDTYGEARPRDKTEATLDKVARMCHAQPDNKTCVQLRDQCRTKYDTIKPSGQRLCRQIGAGPAAAEADAPVGIHSLYAFQYAKLTDSAAIKGNESFMGGHIGGRGFSTDGPYASQFEVTVAKAKSGWFWEFTLCAGLGFQIGRPGRFGLVAGLRGSGITKGGLETAWGIPVEAHVMWSLAPKLSVLGYVRPIWHVGDTRRVDGGLIGDEFELGGDVIYARQTAPGGSNIGLAAGLMLHQMAGSNYVGIRLGFGSANRNK